MPGPRNSESQVKSPDGDVFFRSSESEERHPTPNPACVFDRRGVAIHSESSVRFLISTATRQPMRAGEGT